MTRLLTIAGHDPVHGAGITADLAVWAAMGLDGCSAITALTVQNSEGLIQVLPMDPLSVRSVLQALLRDGEPAAIKIGMLGSAAMAREVSDFLAGRRCPVVVDPVLGGSNGWNAYDRDEVGMEALRALMRRADVITPNLPEAAALLQVSPSDVLHHLDGLRAWSGGAVVLKGGHAEGPFSVDRVMHGDRSAWLQATRLPGSAHGSGCVFSAALAGMLAQGWNVFDACCEAKLRATAGQAQARTEGPGRPHMNAAPVLTSDALPTFHWSDDASPARHRHDEGAAQSVRAATAFPPPAHPLGFYAVLPSADWIEHALSCGVRTLQLRIKEGSLPQPELFAQLRAAVRAAGAVPGAQLFINDHWQDALELGAYGVHLGQEDMATADWAALRAAGLRLGLSTHTPLEISRAHALRPSCIAIGPVYPTTLKAMAYAPVGLQRLRSWAAHCKPAYPVVAIGGISLERAPAVMACGVDSVAVVSALTQAGDSRSAAAAFMACVARFTSTREGALA